MWSGHGGSEPTVPQQSSEWSLQEEDAEAAQFLGVDESEKRNAELYIPGNVVHRVPHLVHRSNDDASPPRIPVPLPPGPDFRCFLQHHPAHDAGRVRRKPAAVLQQQGSAEVEAVLQVQEEFLPRNGPLRLPHRQVDHDVRNEAGVRVLRAGYGRSRMQKSRGPCLERLGSWSEWTDWRFCPAKTANRVSVQIARCCRPGLRDVLYRPGIGVDAGHVAGFTRRGHLRFACDAGESHHRL